MKNHSTTTTDIELSSDGDDLPGMAIASADTPTTRREFGRRALGVGAAVVASTVLGACDYDAEYDYIVVGSGPGGGPVAARLAAAGYSVAVLEAGIDPLGPEAAGLDPSVATFYQVPGFAAATGEHPLLSWAFHVRHYADEGQQERDSKYVPGRGVLYPRGSTLGGSSAHNVMVFIYPHDADFDQIAEATGDRSWASQKMRSYFERVENCQYCEPQAPGHGFSGYFPTNHNEPAVFELYPTLADLATAGQKTPDSVAHGNPYADINHPLVAAGDTGAFVTPLHAAQRARVSVREHLVDTQAKYPKQLHLITGALVSRVLFEGKTAVGVEYMVGANLYAADANYDPAARPQVSRISARREVIVSAGAFNTPQLLKLSGVGPKRELLAHGIRVVVDLPGVGENLQDRYEVTVNSMLKEDLGLFTACTTGQVNDPCAIAYATGEWNPAASTPFHGPYASNAVLSTRIEKSRPSVKLPDLFMVALPGPWRGFYPGYSQDSSANSWTWLVLKAHNENTGGRVRLRSADPRDTPDINFHYFQEGTDKKGLDLDAVVSGIKLARGYNAEPLAAQHIQAETLPGADVTSDSALRDYVKSQAWGHHAACSAKIGHDDDRMAVLDSRFRVRGVERLRVVDASVFPRLPGFFPIAAVLMISEKAADDILSKPVAPLGRS